MRVCGVEGCKSKHKGRGYCSTHYKRWQRTGDADESKPIHRRTTVTPDLSTSALFSAEQVAVLLTLTAEQGAALVGAIGGGA